MTIREAVLKSLEDINSKTNYMEICNHIIKHNYYDFKGAKTPSNTISATLTYFINNGDARVKRIKDINGSYSYYLAKSEQNLDLDTIHISKEKK
jgi:uncharacterized protein